MTRHPITEQHVVLELSGMHDLPVQRDLVYADSGNGPLHMDLYAADTAGPPRPAVVLVTGYSDTRGRDFLGCSLKDMAAYRDWARLIACRGMSAITYEADDPALDVRVLMRYLHDNAASLHLDASRLGLWSSSGNVPNALALLRAGRDFTCAVLCYGYCEDAPGFSGVADAAAQFGFVVPETTSEAELPSDLPLLIVRAGRDEMPQLNASLDRFVAAALQANLDVSVVNYPDGQHAFDIRDANDRSRRVIHRVLDFLALHLRA